MRLLKWLYPGMKVKRWVLLLALGIVLMAMGVELCVMKERVPPKESIVVVYSGSTLLIVGVVLVIVGIRRMIKTLTGMFLPERERLVDYVYRERHKRKLLRGPKVVVIGGGTGLSVLLRGLKEYTSNITAVVTVTDTGGSSGKLRTQLDTLPPGDIRSCLVALADAEPLMSELFQYRFEEGSELAGHSFGNLFITALSKVTGDFERAVSESSKVLAIRGRVVPSTLGKVMLVAEFDDGTQEEGETRITAKRVPIKRVYLKPRDCKPSAEAIDAIRRAELIVMGPGSLYTSVIPNLLIGELTHAILASPAVKVYICNVMTEAGETDGYSAFDHLDALARHIDPKIVKYCILNTTSVPDELLARYREEDAYPVVVDSEKIREGGYVVIEEELISTRDFVRHDSEKLARIIMSLEIKEKGSRKF